MAKSKKQFICQSCQSIQPQWFGRCPQCQAWGTLVEQDITEPDQKSKRAYTNREPKLVALNDFSDDMEPRIDLPNQELHRVFGGGLTQGSVTLISGMPGIGKSTLLLQLLGDLAKTQKKPLIYVSGEESQTQIQKRAQRLNITSDHIGLICQTNVEKVLPLIEKTRPLVVIIDSIQTMYHPNLASIPGSVSQVRETSDRLVRFAKDQNIAFLIVGHVTKDGSVAGPMMLEHLVDTVLHFDGNVDQTHRILRTLKNRFGPTFEIGIFEMLEQGLVEVSNPSQYFLPDNTTQTSGSVVFPAIEGSRVWMVEVQALVTPTTYGTPIRNVVGMDKNRLTMLLAVLEKRCNLPLSTKDLYINIVGGLKITEPALDTAIIAAVISSLVNLPFPSKALAMGEVGLSGEIRPTQKFDARVREAVKLGIKCIYAPTPKKPTKDLLKDVTFKPIQNVGQVMSLFHKD